MIIVIIVMLIGSVKMVTVHPALICGLRKTEGLCVTKIVKPMTYRVMYYVRDERGSIIPQHTDFSTFWRAKLEVWLLRHKKEVTPDIGICVFKD